MAKSKLVKANDKIAEKVVGGFKAIENGVVGAYSKIEDKFVDQFLTKDGETVEEAKVRLKQEDAIRRQRAKERQESRSIPHREAGAAEQ